MLKLPDYIKKWITILNQMKNDNTYKLAWGRAIIEICMNKDYDKSNLYGEIKLSFEEIGKKMLKYYWNQIFYFNLKQGPDNINNKQPEMVKYTKELIEDYKFIYDTNKPEWFNKVFPNPNSILNEKYNRFINKAIPNTLKSNVSYRFLKVNETDDIGVYKYNQKEKFITLRIYDAIQLKEYGDILTQLFNYKWSLLLEKFNLAPKIGNKVRGSGDEEIKRNNLAPYKKILLLQFGEGLPRDFYTDQILSESDISIDHVIPWSFVYDDDIWNLVITSKSNNSKKSNTFVDEEFIERLIARNKTLINILEQLNNKIYEKYIYDLHSSIDNNVVSELYSYFK